MDVAILRDVIERHGVSNPLPLRSLQRHLLTNPAAPFSVQKFYDSLRSQGISVGKDTLHTLLGYLEDTFLVRVIALHTASERQRMIHPRKVYPVDPGLIPVYERSGRLNLGHALETAVLVEWNGAAARCRTSAPARASRWTFGTLAGGPLDTASGLCRPGGPQHPGAGSRGLAAAAAEYPDAAPLLITLDAVPPQPALPAPLQWQAAAGWLLGCGLESEL